jgi:heme exporter protein D
MGGYALYVWSAYGLGLVVLVLNTVLPLRQERQLLRKLAKQSTARVES